MRKKVGKVTPGVKRFIVMQMPKTSYSERFEDNEQLNSERFATYDEALRAIYDECKELVDNDTELRVGNMPNFLMRYAIYEMVDEMAFDLNISYKITRKKKDGDTSESKTTSE